jgi:hypothetical protein
VPIAVCYSRGVEQSSSCAEGSSALMTSQGLDTWMKSQGSDKTERGRTKRRSTGGLGCLPFGFGFERSKSWAGHDGP